jgi:hypothetical protein
MYYPSSDELDKMKESSYYLQDKDFYHICKIFNICIYLRTQKISDKTENKWIKLNPMKTTRCIYINHIDLIHWELLKLKERPSVNKSRRSAKQSSRQSRQSAKQSDNTHKVPKNDSTPVYNIAMGVFLFIILVGVSY